MQKNDYLRNYTYFKFHITRKHGEAPNAGNMKAQDFKCENCPRRFRFEGQLKNHKETCDPKFFCQVCDSEFAVKAKQHIAEVHDGAYGPVCRFCDQNFSSFEVMIKHRKLVHERVKSAHCRFCSKDFQDKDKLMEHMQRNNACRAK